jgi:O-antigen ligase
MGEPLAIVRDPLRIALFVLTVLTIGRVHQHYPLLAKLRPALLLVVASVGYAYLNPKYLAQGNVLKLWPMRNVAILGVLACCSAAFGISLGGSAVFILNSYSKTLAYAFLIAVSIRNARDLFTYVWAYVIACAILLYFSLFVFGLSKGTGGYVTRLNDLYTYDSNDLGVVIMVGMALTLLLVVVSNGKRRLFLVAVVLGIGATVARSGSRGGFLGFIAAGLAALVLANGVSVGRRVSVLVAIVIALLVGSPPGYWKQMGTIMKPAEDYNYSALDGRKALILRAVGYVEKYPIFGLGIDNFGKAECTISPKLESLRTNGPRRCVQPHNSFLQAAAELGIPGFILWISLVLGGIVAPLRLRRRLPKSWRHGTESERFMYAATSFFPIAMVGFAVTSFFVSFAWMDPVYLMAALLSGLYVSAQAQMEENRRAGTGNQIRTASAQPVAGWRVRQSAWRSQLFAQLQFRTR